MAGLAGWRDGEGVARLARFVLVGGAATAIYFGVALLADLSGASLMVAHVIGFVVSILASYAGHKIFTFQVKGDHVRSGARFAAATVFIAGTQALLVYQLGAMRTPPAAVFLISAGYYPVASFILHSLWTFRARRPAEAAPEG